MDSAPAANERSCTICGEPASVKFGRGQLCGSCFLDRSESHLARFGKLPEPEPPEN
jgi:hypothetical protein